MRLICYLFRRDAYEKIDKKMFVTIQIRQFKWTVPNRMPSFEEREMIQDIIDFIKIAFAMLKKLRKPLHWAVNENWLEAIRTVGLSINAVLDYSYELREVVDAILALHTSLTRIFPFESVGEFVGWCKMLEEYIILTNCFVIVLKQILEYDERMFLDNPDRLIVLHGFPIYVKEIKDEILGSIMPSYWS